MNKPWHHSSNKYGLTGAQRRESPRFSFHVSYPGGLRSAGTDSKRRAESVSLGIITRARGNAGGLFDDDLETRAGSRKERNGLEPWEGEFLPTAGLDRTVAVPLSNRSRLGAEIAPMHYSKPPAVIHASLKPN